MINRPLSRRSYRKPDLRYSPVDLVVCEGETEIDYLSETARNLSIHVYICQGDGTDPMSIVKTAKRKAKSDGVQKDPFCLSREVMQEV
jgi:hypothetical protein